MIDLEHGTHIDSVHCTGDWLLDCKFSESVYLCRGLGFSSKCILSVGGVDNPGPKTLMVFNRTVSKIRWIHCLDAIRKIFRIRNPFLYDANKCVWEPTLSLTTIEELRSFSEFDPRVFDQLFKPYPIAPSIKETKLGLILNR